MSDCLSVIVGGFTADGVTADGDGICYTVESLDGWYGSPSLSVQTVEVAPFGEVITVARENGRAVSLTLTAHAPGGRTALGQTLCQTAINTVKAAFAALYAPVTLEVVDPIHDQFLDVRLVSAVLVSILGDGVAVRFLIQLLGPDPVIS